MERVTESAVQKGAGQPQGKTAGKEGGGTTTSLDAGSTSSQGLSSRQPEIDISQRLISKTRVSAREKWFETMNKLDVIRVGVIESDGMGDQTAAVAIMENIVDFSFAGHLQLIYHAEDDAALSKLRGKLGSLLPGFQADICGVQTVTMKMREWDCIPSQELERFSREKDIDPEQPLAIWPLKCERSWLCTNFGLVIPPYGWKKEAARLEAPEGVRKIITMPELASYQQCYVEPENPIGLLSDDSPVTPGLSCILNYAKSREIHLLPVYGIHHADVLRVHDIVVRRLLKSVRQPAADNKPTVLLVISPLATTDAIQSVAEKLNVPFTNLKDRGGIELKEMLTASDPQTGAPGRYLFYCGRLDKPVFDWICHIKDYTLVQEGANSASFMHQLGKSYLPLLPLGDTRLPVLPTQATGVGADARSRVEQAGHLLTSDSRLCCHVGNAIEAWARLRGALTLDATFHSALEKAVLENQYDQQAWADRLGKAFSPEISTPGAEAASPSSTISPADKKAALDGLGKLIPALHAPLPETVKPPFLQGVPDSNRRVELIRAVSKSLFDDSPGHASLVDDLKPGEDPELGQLTEIIDGQGAQDYFRAVQKHARLPENNAVSFAFKALDNQDWNDILDLAAPPLPAGVCLVCDKGGSHAQTRQLFSGSNVLWMTKCIPCDLRFSGLDGLVSHYHHDANHLKDLSQLLGKEEAEVNTDMIKNTCYSKTMFGCGQCNSKFKAIRNLETHLQLHKPVAEGATVPREVFSSSYPKAPRGKREHDPFLPVDDRAKAPQPLASHFDAGGL